MPAGMVLVLECPSSMAIALPCLYGLFAHRAALLVYFILCEKHCPSTA